MSALFAHNPYMPILFLVDDASPKHVSDNPPGRRLVYVIGLGV
ncbi:MAG: hypothetical protein V1861_04045 [Candidatus Micrarchaeota archaeon]